MANIGYKRCSTDEDKQNVDRQLQGVQLDKTFIEYASGKSEQGRAVFQEMLSILKSGDHVFFNELSRAGRNTGQLLTTIDSLLARGVTIHFVTEGFVLEDNPSTNPMQKALTKVIITVVAACNELFLAQTSIAVKQGLAAAKAKGKLIGAASPKHKASFQANKANHVKTYQKEQSRAALQPIVLEVRKMIEYSKDQLKLDDIAQNLNSAGMTTATGKPWKKANVSLLIKEFGIQYKRKNCKC